MKFIEVLFCVLRIPPGLKNRSWTCGSVWNLAKVREVNHPQVRLCLDTNHAWADCDQEGKFDPRSTKDWARIENMTSVVHLNSIPVECLKGIHLDRHSKHLIEDCSIDNGFLFHIYDRCNWKQIPMVLERRDYNLSLKDMVYLRECRNT